MIPLLTIMPRRLNLSIVARRSATATEGKEEDGRSCEGSREPDTGGLSEGVEIGVSASWLTATIRTTSATFLPPLPCPVASSCSSYSRFVLCLVRTIFFLAPSAPPPPG